MPAFQSWRSYYEFAHSTATEWRYSRSVNQKSFVDAVISSAKRTRLATIPRGTTLWRAQKGFIWTEVGEGKEISEIRTPFQVERMKPLRDRATEGRANPKGIPCLYAATERETAIAEVRPWIGTSITVAALTTSRPITLVNCTSEIAGELVFYLKEPGISEIEEANWKAIDEAFSRPITPTDQLADYVPTQILAESFRQEGFDGVAYRSALGPPHNIALFDLDAANVESRRLCRVTSVSIRTEDD